MAQLPQTFPSKNWKPRFSSMTTWVKNRRSSLIFLRWLSFSNASKPEWQHKIQNGEEDSWPWKVNYLCQLSIHTWWHLWKLILEFIMFSFRKSSSKQNKSSSGQPKVAIFVAPPSSTSPHDQRRHDYSKLELSAIEEASGCSNKVTQVNSWHFVAISLLTWLPIMYSLLISIHL